MIHSRLVMRKILFLLLFLFLAASGGQSGTIYPSYLRIQSGRFFDQIVYTFIPPWILVNHLITAGSFEKDLPDKDFYEGITAPSEGIGVMPVEAESFQKKVLAGLEKNSPEESTSVHKPVYLAKLESPFKFSGPVSGMNPEDQKPVKLPKFPKQGFFKKVNNNNSNTINEIAQETIFKTTKGELPPEPGNMSIIIQFKTEPSQFVEPSANYVATSVMFEGGDEEGDGSGSDSGNDIALGGNVMLTSAGEREGRVGDDLIVVEDDNAILTGTNEKDNQGPKKNDDVEVDIEGNNSITGVLESSGEVKKVKLPDKIKNNMGVYSHSNLNFKDELRKNKNLMSVFKLAHSNMENHFPIGERNQVTLSNRDRTLVKESRMLRYLKREWIQNNLVNKEVKVMNPNLRRDILLRRQTQDLFHGLVKVKDTSLARDPIVVSSNIRQISRKPLSRSPKVSSQEVSREPFVRRPVVVQRPPVIENPLSDPIPRVRIDPLADSGRGSGRR